MAINSDPSIHNLVICANMFVKKDEHVLMIKRSLEKVYLPGYIQPIGGKVEINEEPLQAAKRELQEEAGIEVQNIRLEAVVTEVFLDKSEKYKCNWLIFHFSGEYVKKDVINTNTEEGELIWITKQDIKKYKCLQQVKTIFEQLSFQQHSIIFSKNIWGNNTQELLSNESESIECS